MLTLHMINLQADMLSLQCPIGKEVELILVAGVIDGAGIFHREIFRFERITIKIKVRL